MKDIKKLSILVCIFFVVLLTLFSVISPFLGSDLSRTFFSSVPLTVFWFFFLGICIAGLFFYRSVVVNKWLFMVHIGIVFVLVGGIWSSRVAHRLAGGYLGSGKEHSGYMLIEQGRVSNVLFSNDMREKKGELPFKVELLNFWVEYYRSGRGTVTGINGEGKKFFFELGEELPAEFDISEDVKLVVIRRFENFKLRVRGAGRDAIDQKGLGNNPAVEVEIHHSDGSVERGYLFERFPGLSVVGAEFQLAYSAGRRTGISDYKSYVRILSEGDSSPLAAGIIEVNKPLHYGGYHLYQYSYDSKNMQYTILYVVSDSGLYIVYAGLWLLGLGAAGRFWIKPATKYFKSKKRATYGN